MEEIKATTAAAENELAREYEAYLQTAADAKAEYLRVYKEIIGKLSIKHLEAYNKILAQDGEEVQNWDAICQTMREKWLNILTESFEAFWQEHDVGNCMASLELLKHKFKAHEGISWNLQQKTAAQRILPIQIQLKQMKVCYLEKQLQQQQERLEQLMQENRAKRERIQSVSQRRVECEIQMKTLSSAYKETSKALNEMVDTILEPL